MPVVAERAANVFWLPREAGGSFRVARLTVSDLDPGRALKGAFGECDAAKAPFGASAASWSRAVRAEIVALDAPKGSLRACAGISAARAYFTSALAPRQGPSYRRGSRGFGLHRPARGAACP
ncbi:hypothetical protein GCM10009754_80370 [Amycolatopsis minnesotensis]|uniref:Uncharacterized protein n=1 Tax=Amycolatopsis minnesotensis TaxID=337894 RepID=A0ABP5E4W8_9PSEU